MLASLFLGTLVTVNGVGIKAEVYSENEDSLYALYGSYLKQFNKNYSDKEQKIRYTVFKKQIKRINEHNREFASNPKVLHSMGLNQFSDWYDTEFAQYNKYKPSQFGKAPDVKYYNAETDPNYLRLTALPDSIDWSTHSPPVVTPIKDQGQCGGCWAFGATGSWESRWALATGTLNSLSEQELIDCVPTEDCLAGGFSDAAFSWGIKNGGDALESDYVYKGHDGKCTKDQYKQYNPLKGIFIIARDNETAMMEALQTGPITVAVDAMGWNTYRSGIYSAHCGTSLDHNVICVGYGQDTSGNKYWKIKNSWGKSWGEDGYIRLCRECGNNGNKGQCGVQMQPSYPMVNVTAIDPNKNLL